jgi:hypothetical protein
VADTRAPGTGREHSTGALPRSTPDALMAARGLDWKAVPPPDHDSADTELIEVFTPKRRRLSRWLLLILGALLGLAVLVGIVVSVLTVSDDSTVPPEQFAPLTPISVPAQAPTPSPSQAAPSPSVAPPSDLTVPPLPPVTATGETVTTAPPYPHDPNSPRMRDRLHQLFPRLFPDDPENDHG